MKNLVVTVVCCFVFSINATAGIKNTQETESFDAMESKKKNDCHDFDRRATYRELYKYVEKGNYNEAKQWIDDKFKKEGFCTSIFELIKIDIDYLKLAKQPRVNSSEWYDIAQRYRFLLLKDQYFRSDFIIYLRMAEIAKVLGHFQDVVDLSREGLKVQIIGRFYELAVIAFYNLGDFESAVSLFDEAYSLNPKVLFDVEVMTSLSRSYSKLGKNHLASQTLLRLVENNPEAKHTKEFISASDLIEKN